MEEERRLCYVGMTRAEKRLILTWAKYRRRFGGGEQERTIKSRFLKEVPENLVISLGVDDSEEDDIEQVDLTAERYQVRQDARKNLYTGKTYNSVENVQQFFKERGGSAPSRPASTALAFTPAAGPFRRLLAVFAPWLRPPRSERTLVGIRTHAVGRCALHICRTGRYPRPPVTPQKRPAPPVSRPVQGGLFSSPAPPYSPAPPTRPPQLIPPVQSRTELPKVPPPRNGQRKQVQ